MVLGSSRGGSAGPNSDAGAFISTISSTSSAIAGRAIDRNNVSDIPQVLPHERVFPVQIGGELFKLSGASLSSDGSFCALYSLLSLPQCPLPSEALLADESNLS